jgi:hypothetical protein
MREDNQTKYVGGFKMAGVDPTTDIRMITGVFNTFGWELLKQTITKEDMTLVIWKKLIPAPKDSKPKAPPKSVSATEGSNSD